MNVPAIAQKTFNEFKHKPNYLGFVEMVLKKLTKIHEPRKRAEFVHKLVDEATQDVFSNPTVQKLSPCQKGCTGCCHTQVSITEDEAHLLASRIESGLEINVANLKLQMQAKNDSEAFFAIPYESRKCVFLNEKGACRVYHDRPSVCRTNSVLGSAEQCDTSNGVKPVRLVKTVEADLVIYASYLHSKTSGALPYVLAKVLGYFDQ